MGPFVWVLKQYLTFGDQWEHIGLPHNTSLPPLLPLSPTGMIDHPEVFMAPKES